MERVPELGRDEDLFPRDTRVLDSLTNFILVLVDECTVEMTIAILEGVGDRLTNLSRRRLPSTYADGQGK